MSLKPPLAGLLPVAGLAFDGTAAGSRRWRLLVIGYGNELRGDDAAGPAVARAIEDCQMEGVLSLDVPLLLPDLAVDMAEAEKVVFVDASRRCSGDHICLSVIAGAAGWPILSCAYSAEMIWSLCRSLYGHTPDSWLLEIPASRFDIGGSMSARTERAVRRASSLIRRWIDTKGSRV